MRIVVQEWERVLVYRDGRFEEILGPGAHRRPRRRRRRLPVLVRPRLLVVPAQEVLTADGLSVKVSVVVSCRTTDPRRWFEAVDNPDGYVYALLQVALREAVATRPLDELLADRRSLGEEMRSSVSGSVATVGVEIETLALRDVMVPAELRRAAAEVVAARAQGQAALERARSEVAAARALTNAARMVAEQPGLLQLRMLQAIESGGATVVLGAGAGFSDPRIGAPPAG